MRQKISERLYFLCVHQWKYSIAILRSKWYTKEKTSKVTRIVYVAREKDKDWIFGAKVRRLSKYSFLNSTVYFNNKLRNLPDADGYYFIYQNYFCRAIRSTPSILNRKNIVMFTHPNWSKKYSKTHVVWCLNKADHVICLNSEIKSYLISIGVRPAILEVIHIGVSSHFFSTHERRTKNIGLCSKYHSRKNPDLLLEIVKHMPQLHFYLLGQSWENYERFDELLALSNFTYYTDKPYASYPDFYATLNVFLSPSILEGGPVPLLEAMMSNCVPVASNTGFAPDLITSGENGFLFDVTATYHEVIPLIQKALDISTDVRSTVLEHTWENCAKRIDELFIAPNI